MLPHYFLDQLAHSRFLRDIDGVPFQSRSVCPRRALQSIELFLRAIGNDDLGAFLKECQSHGAPQSTRAAGHQDHFPLEFRTHQRTSPINALLTALFN
jgi:hypothetical protein